MTLTSDQLDVLAVLVYGESSSGQTPLLVSELKIWALLNRLSHQWWRPDRSVASVWFGAEKELIEEHLGLSTSNETEAWTGLLSFATQWNSSRQAYRDIRNAIDRIYPLWRDYGANSAYDPTHGSVAFSDISRDELSVSERTDYAKVQVLMEARIRAYKERQLRHPDFNYYITGIYVIGTDPYTGKPIYNFTSFGGCPPYRYQGEVPACPKS